jgi:hypothetical protein
MAKVLERSLYETDYYAWTKQQAAELRRLAAARANTHARSGEPGRGGGELWDTPAFGREEPDAPGHRTSSQARILARGGAARWMAPHYPGSPRRDIGRLTAALRHDAEAALDLLYEQSRRRAKAAMNAHGETEAAQALPTTCPYSFDQLVSHDWYPANRHGIHDDVVNA